MGLGLISKFQMVRKKSATNTQFHLCFLLEGKGMDTNREMDKTPSPACGRGEFVRRNLELQDLCGAHYLEGNGLILALPVAVDICYLVAKIKPSMNYLNWQSSLVAQHISYIPKNSLADSKRFELHFFKIQSALRYRYFN